MCLSNYTHTRIHTRTLTCLNRGRAAECSGCACRLIHTHAYTHVHSHVLTEVGLQSAVDVPVDMLPVSLRERFGGGPQQHEGVAGPGGSTKASPAAASAAASSQGDGDGKAGTKDEPETGTGTGLFLPGSAS
jgi:hypothetical protein